jgi:hypothetical protein
MTAGRENCIIYAQHHMPYYWGDKSRWMRWTVRVERMRRDKKFIHNYSWKSWRKTPIGRPRYRSENNIVTCRSVWLYMGYGLDIGFVDHLYTPLGSTGNYSAVANLNNLRITTAPARPFPACYVLTSHSLATASNSGYSSASRPQL